MLFRSLLNKERRPAILLGPSSTEALEPVAEAAPLWNLIQVWFKNVSPLGGVQNKILPDGNSWPCQLFI